MENIQSQSVNQKSIKTERDPSTSTQLFFNHRTFIFGQTNFKAKISELLNMSRAPIAEPEWAESIHFDLFHCKLATATGDFAYFHNTRAQWGNKRHVFNELDDKTKAALGAINEQAALAHNTVMEKLKDNIENTEIDKSKPEDVQKQDWETAIRIQNEEAKKTINDQMDATAEEAISVIKQLPEGTQSIAASAYQVGVNLVMTAFEFLAAKIKEIYNHIVDFLRGVWDVLVNTYEAVKDWVGGVVGQIRNFFGFSLLALTEANGVVDMDGMFKSVSRILKRQRTHDSIDPNGSQAAKFLLSLLYSFRVPHDEVVASTDRIWDSYLTQYSEATSAQEPQNVSISRKPKPEGERDTDGKLMFISWHAGGGAGNGRDLIEPLIQSEQKALAGSYSGGLRYNIVDMGDSSKATQKKRGVGKKQDIELRGQRYKAQY